MAILGDVVNISFFVPLKWLLGLFGKKKHSISSFKTKVTKDTLFLVKTLDSFFFLSKYRFLCQNIWKDIL